MKAPKISEGPTSFLKIRISRTAKTTAAKRPRMKELRQVGGRSSLAVGRRLARACAFASSRVRGRLRRAFGSTRPPWVPRRLRRRFLFVWAMRMELHQISGLLGRKFDAVRNLVG